MSSRPATALGLGAILLWATLASLTALKGPLPPFQTTALVFAIGGALIVAAAVVRRRAVLLRPTRASLALGIYGLFGYHALYFAALRLAPPAEASLITSLWALLTVLFSGLLPGHRLRLRHILGALLGFAAAAILVGDKLGAGQRLGPGLGHDVAAPLWGYVMALGCAFVWSSYSVASRLLASVPSESLAAPSLITAVLAGLLSLAFETWTAPESGVAWAALVGLGLGPLGAAFLLWDTGMKKGNVPLLGVLSYVALILSTALLVALGFAEPEWTLAEACVLMVAAAVIAAR
ncbi:MAG: DMT family transporter [Hyphomicrobiaceae bacterium]|nr:DMT family transporter [Hyphomicrobiaceae bacterium]